MTLVLKLVILHIWMGVLITGLSGRKATYQITSQTNVDISNPAAQRTYRSVVECAAACERLKTACNSFVYNKQTSRCTLGTWSYTFYSINNNGLYHKSICDPSQGFQMWKAMSLYGITTTNMCVYLSDPEDKRSFEDADKSCRDKGAHLLSLQTRAKFFLFENNIRNYNSHVWVGLDDRQTENQFVWHADGSLLTQPYPDYMFTSGQPDNEEDREDCIEYSPEYPPLNDAPCESWYRYICELPTLD